MILALDRELVWTFGGVLALLVVASLTGAVLARTVESLSGRRPLPT
jgi:hypothetical protein